MNTVLLFESEVPTAPSLAKALSAAGFSVHRARDGVEAIAEVDRFDFDAAVVDVASPDITGGQVAHALRKQDAELPIFVCTGLDADSVAKWATEDRVLVLEKPVDEAQLIWLLRTHLGNLE